jgi:two-component system chemotaxis response regulator CheB
VAVVLSGLLDDGAAGAAAVRDRGGAVLVQDPADALYPAMPATVIARIGPDAVGSAVEMGALIAKFCGSARAEGNVSEDEMHDENNQSGRALGPASGFICPDCNGSLYTVDDGALLRFRCRVGHAWGAENLVHQQGVSIEGALWVALRTLEEKAELSQRLADRAAVEGRTLTRGKFIESVAETLRSAAAIKRLLDAGVGGSHSLSEVDAAPDVVESAGSPPVAS